MTWLGITLAYVALVLNCFAMKYLNECGCSQIHQKIIYRGMGRQHH